MKNNPWFFIQKPKPQAKMRLICFPYAGGGANVFHEWGGKLPANIEIVAVKLPGRENRLMEEPLSTVKDVVDALLDNMDELTKKPFAFFGHSNGSTICYELAKALQKQGLKQPFHVILSAKAPPTLPATSPLTCELTDEEFVAKLRSLNGTSMEVLDNKELLSLHLPMLRADFGMCDNLDYNVDVKLKAPVSLMFGNRDSVNQQVMLQWQELVSDIANVYQFAGGHFFIHTHQQELLHCISTIFEKVQARRLQSAFA